MRFIILCSIVILYFNLASGLRILGVFPHMGKTHFTVFKALLRGLAEKGHQVTVIGHFPAEGSIKNYRDISIRGTVPILDTPFSFDDFTFSPLTEKFMKPFVTASLLTNLGSLACRGLAENAEVQKIQPGQYDLIITEQFNTDCGLGLVHKLKVPFVGITSHILMPFHTERLGLIENPSYVASHMFPWGKTPNVFQRIETFAVNAFFKLAYRHWFQIPERELLAKHFGEDMPDLDTIARNMSLMLANTYFPLNGAHPKPNNYIEIGGIHLHYDAKQKLDPDLQKFLDEADQGFILFTMGSMIKASTWPQDKLKALKEAFAELPQRVLWKWEADSMAEQPHNVKISKWIPQLAVLQHKNIKAFITHSGVSGLYESIHYGVPMLCLPLYSDQGANAKAAEEAGAGLLLPINNITKESILWGLGEVMSDRMKASTLKLSAIWKDRPKTAMDNAIYWIEHVSRYGSTHLRSAGIDVPFIRYYQLDVLAVLFIILAISTVAACLSVYICAKMLKESKNKNKRE